MFGRGVLDKVDLISQLKSTQDRHARHGNTFTFEDYLGLSFASNILC